MRDELEELAFELFLTDNCGQSREQSARDWEWFNEPGTRGGVQHYRSMARGVLAAGYRKQAPDE